MGAPYGVRGWLKLHSHTEPASNICQYRSWHIKQRKRAWQPIQVTAIKPHANSFIAKLVDIETPEQAALLTNALVGIPKDALPTLPEGEYYWSDLVGLEVINDDNTRLGVVDSLFETGSNDVMVVKKGEEQCLLPYHPSVIQSIDLKQSCIRVTWHFDE